MFDPVEDWTRITASTHPQVHAAFDVISGTHHAAYNVPPEYTPYLPSSERVLEELNETDRLSLCWGDFEDPVILSIAFVNAANLLAAFSYDWPVFPRKRRRVKCAI
jgi:hypothetical protein